jgi:hypothetical protein
MPQKSAVTADEQKLNDLCEEHLRTEFNAHSADEAIATILHIRFPEPLVPAQLNKHQECSPCHNNKH